MTRHEDRRFDPTTDDDRVMTDTDRIDPDRTTSDALGGTTDDRYDDRMADDTLGRTTDDRYDDRTTDDALSRPADDRYDDRTSDAGLADRTTDDRTTDETVGAPAVEDPLVAPDAVVDFRTRWEVIQQGFVDDPRNAVSEADNLVDDLLKRLSDTFDQQHQELEKQWSDGEPSTEDLRSALQRYRAFFQRLLTL
ncbi:hypothetical protein [Kribbella sp. NBC_00359]|uniref:hypothetical protein n=1 Tax=Kribbella sp. NBC_00359 TaxID=2975966 RepID=UPI002E2167C9